MILSMQYLQDYLVKRYTPIRIVMEWHKDSSLCCMRHKYDSLPCRHRGPRVTNESNNLGSLSDTCISQLCCRCYITGCSKFGVSGRAYRIKRRRARVDCLTVLEV